MQKRSSLGKSQIINTDPFSGEFDELLREIEKEAVPRRLLASAQKLQAALARQKARDEDCR